MYHLAPGIKMARVALQEEGGVGGRNPCRTTLWPQSCFLTVSHLGSHLVAIATAAIDVLMKSEFSELWLM